MYKRLSIYHLAIFSIFCSLFISQAATVQAETNKTDSYTIKSIKAEQQDNAMIMVLEGDSTPAYTMYELFNPARIVLDIAEAKIDPSVNTGNILPANGFATLKVSTLADQTPQITRFEITLAESHGYKIDTVNNNLSIKLFPKKTAEAIAVLEDMVVRKKANKTEVLLRANTPITNFRYDTVTGRNGLPDSMYLDVNNVDGSELSREKSVGTNLDKIRVATRGSGVRIVFEAAKDKQLFSFDVKTAPQGLLITINEKAPEAQPAAGKDAFADNAVASDPTLDALIESSEVALTDNSREKADAAEEMQDSFGFSGYKSNRISVDFYKIDLHNVFRLFREISGVNLIVDEDVSGSLTLSLNDVPWDFALDIILNLKGLKKEERFNTIVISTKEFVWPENASDNLSFEADVEVIEEEALVIQQSMQQTAEIVKAKELLRRAKIEEKNGDLEDAASFYEQAFKLWPDNLKISNRLATLYLTELHVNAQALHFAKESLKVDKDNYNAALYAAIASANMDQVSSAMEYFNQSISGQPPLKEALLSYAAFSEDKGQPEAAIKLLDCYTKEYSDTVETMIAKARLYDSMGQKTKATEQYKALLYSGYQLVPGLKKYIRSRLTAKN